MLNKIGAPFLLLTLLASSFSAQGNDTKRVYEFKSSDGVSSFSDMRPIDAKYKIFRVDCYACQVDLYIDWRKTKLYVEKYSQHIENAAYKYSVDPAYVRAIIHAESHFNPNAVSSQGAQGLMQLMPKTAASLGVINPLIAVQNINGGVKHLAKLLKKYQGNIRLASAAYNAGEGAVRKYQGIPPYAETKVYVERVEILHQRYLRK